MVKEITFEKVLHVSGGIYLLSNTDYFKLLLSNVAQDIRFNYLFKINNRKIIETRWFITNSLLYMNVWIAVKQFIIYSSID